jgi:polysaccharide export outer membrane protein
MKKAIRVLVANRPRLMREAILGTLSDQPWIEVVGEVSNDAEIPDHVSKTLPDLLVIAVDGPGERPALCDALLQKYPELRIIAVAPHQDYGVCYWASLDIHSNDIEPSEAGFLGAVRHAAEGVGVQCKPNALADATQCAAPLHFKSLHNSRFLVLMSFVVLILTCPATQAQVQEQENDRRPAPRNAVTSMRAVEPSDLAKENIGRVAASAAQLQTVLLKDAGILVELKTWVAREATNNGQVVEDTLLTDQAIFDRLDRDVAFRSVATRLVQRYGYLLPSVNPDSDIGKQQELLLKERARRLAEREDREEAEGSVPQEGDKNQSQRQRTVERTACDSGNQGNQANCNDSAFRRRRQGGTPPEEMPGGEPSFPVFPPQTSPLDSTRTPRLAVNRDESDVGEYSSDPSVMLASDSSRRSLASPAASTAVPSTGLGGAENLIRRNSLDDLSGMATGSRTETAALSLREKNSMMRLPGDRGVWGRPDRDLEPVSMVHKVNPYADIPSLYDMYVQAASRDRQPDRFGMEIFRNGTREQDAIPMDLPVGPDYVVGPGDGLAINLWGGVSQRLVRLVDREGRISLPEAGPLLVSGRTLGEVQESVQQVLRTQFREISVDVSLARLRTIRVYIVGEVAEPGAYDISSLSSPLNALFAAGGITQRGSLRHLKHYRGTQLIEEVDAYELLLHGVGSELKRLENGDSLLVPPMGGQVTVSGMVRRPAVYELRGESSLTDVLDLAGGILPAAALQHIELQRLQAHEKRTMLTLNLSPESTTAVAEQLSSFKIQDGDEIHIFPIAPYNQQAIYLQGHVLRPGRYSYHDGMRLTDLIASYSDLLPEPAGHYGEIVRLNSPDFRPSVESFDLAAALADPAASPKLQPLDTVRVFSRYDFEPAPTVWVGGDVRAAGQYRTSGQARLRDAIYLAGGISPDAGLESAQLFRTQPDGTMKIFSVNLGQALAGNSTDNLLLEPRDRILVHRNSARVDPPTVYVKGEVAKPGRYPLTTNMHVEDLVRTAGGLKRSADSTKADLTHYAVGNVPGTSSENVPIELATALSGNGTDNLPLRDGDVLTIREAPGWNDVGASATVRGEVQHAGSYGIRPGERLSSLLDRAGGFSPEAYPYGAVLMRREVRELQMQSHLALVQRMKAEEVNLKALPDGDTDQKNAKLTAIAQTDTVLNQLQANAPIGRVVVHIQPDTQRWRNTSVDVPLRDGDVLVIPKKANYVLVAGQVYNPTAISHRPGRSAQWYLSQAGGLTQMADKKAVFVVRADGSVIAAKNNSGWWSGDPLSSALRPGDSIVVPEKAPRIGTRNWATTLQAAQIATSVALTVAYFKP